MNHSKVKFSAAHLCCAVSLFIFGLPQFVSAQTNFAILADDGGWCWFSDPRALFHNGTLYFGCVRSDGHSVLNEFNLQTGTMTNLWVSSETQFDDHTVCGMTVRDDGTLLALYAQHGSQNVFYYRQSTSTNPVSPADWGPEQTDNTVSGETYCNPYQLSDEGGKIYSFSRDLNYNPTVFVSSDNGNTWSYPTNMIKTGTGSTRPYVKYCSNYTNRIDILYTDAHPDNYTNSLYEMYYQGGGFYQTDGAFIKNYADLPLLHDSPYYQRGSVVYQYSQAPQSDPNQWIPYGRAWCWEIAYQTNGAPVCVFQTKVDAVTGSAWSDARIYYYYARWTGTNWQRRFVAQAGRPLYNGQPDYGGGMALDPVDPNVIYISSDAANPFDLSTTTNVPLGAHYEIYKGVTADGGLTFTWTAVTTNSAVDNCRPYVPRRFGGEPCVLWWRGTYNSYTSFYTQIVGMFTTLVPQTNAESGTWDVDADGLWSGTTNWQDGIVADGPGNTADFSAVDITVDRTVTLDTSRTIGSLQFGDPDGSQNWTLNTSNGSVLTLDATEPLLTVNQNLATLQVLLAGTNGFTKSGPGTLVLAASNSLSGTLNLDSGSTSANDGAVRISSTAALANVASPINFRDNTGNDAVGSLQLDDSTGGIMVTQNFSTSCRNNNTTPTFENIAGTNTLAGTNLVQVGGTNVIYQSDANSLLLVTAPIQYVGTLTAPRFFTFTGDGNTTISYPILAALNNTAPIGLLKNGNGTLTLGGANTYGDGTTVNGGTLLINGSLGDGHVNVIAGTLGGSGVIAGPVNISTGAMLTPGTATIGTLTINNALTNISTILIKFNKTGSTVTNDNVKGVNSLVFGGTLIVTNVGSGILTVDDSLKIFSAATYKGIFVSISPATPGVGLLWDTNNLAVNGTLSVALGNVAPQFGAISLNKTNLIFNGFGGAAGYNYSVLSSTNLASPLDNWETNGTGIFDRSGNLIFTNAINSNSAQRFYEIRIP